MKSTFITNISSAFPRHLKLGAIDFITTTHKDLEFKVKVLKDGSFNVFCTIELLEEEVFNLNNKIKLALGIRPPIQKTEFQNSILIRNSEIISEFDNSETSIIDIAKSYTLSPQTIQVILLKNDSEAVKRRRKEIIKKRIEKIKKEKTEKRELESNKRKNFIISLLKEGKTLRQIGIELGITRERVRQLLPDNKNYSKIFKRKKAIKIIEDFKNGIKENYAANGTFAKRVIGKTPAQFENERIKNLAIKMYKDGMKRPQIARALNKHYSTISRILRYEGKIKCSTKEECQIRDAKIKTLYGSNNYPIKLIATMFDISYQRVSQIINGIKPLIFMTKDEKDERNKNSER